MKMRLQVLALALPLISIIGCAHNSPNYTLPAQAEVLRSTERYQKEYIIAPGDQVEVVVYRQPEFSRHAEVLYDGSISLPVLRRVDAAGLTVPELEEHLTSRYSDRLVEPDVTVIVHRAHEPMIYVVGETAAVQPIPLRMAGTAAQALTVAGGLHKSAAKKQIALIRLDEEGALCAHLLENSGRGAASFFMSLHNVPLQPDDIIVVPESGRAQFVRAMNDFLHTPLGGINQVLTPYIQFAIFREIQDTNKRQDYYMRNR